MVHIGSMKFGYARVSTNDQNPAMQIDALRQAGCHERHIFVDQGKTGATFKRPQLQRCLKALKPGDSLIVWKLDRLGRATRDLLNLLHDLDQRQIDFKSLTDPIDTRTPAGRAMMQFAAVLAELERSVMIERTRAGLALARKNGKRPGPKTKITGDDIDDALTMLEEGKTLSRIAKIMHVDRSTLYRHLRSRMTNPASASKSLPVARRRGA
jgi:DNA invertase Pin-like site-specific DNA recombinase